VRYWRRNWVKRAAVMSCRRREQIVGLHPILLVVDAGQQMTREDVERLMSTAGRTAGAECECASSGNL